jgi:hypothetical protein
MKTNTKGQAEYVFENRNLEAVETGGSQKRGTYPAAKRGCEVFDIRSGALITGAVIE